MGLSGFSVSYLIRQALANDTMQRNARAVRVIEAKRNAVIITELELGKVAVQMLFAAVLEHTFHAALEDAEIALNRVAMNFRVGWVHLDTALVRRSVVRGIHGAHRVIGEMLVGHDRGFASDVGIDDRHKVRGGRATELLWSITVD